MEHTGGGRVAQLTVSDAARVTGVSRMLLYRYIKTGKLSRTPDGYIDTTELLRARLLLQTSDVTTPVTPLQGVTPPAVTPVTPPVTADVTTLERLVTHLEQQLADARIREQTALAREAAAQEERARLLQMLQDAHQRYDRLLDVPRPLPQVAPPLAPIREPLTPSPAPVLPEPSAGTVVDETTRIPAYNPDTHYLGRLCKRGHDWQGTGYSLRHQRGARCLACDAAQARARRRRTPA
jgi:hypothetical protein